MPARHNPYQWSRKANPASAVPGRSAGMCRGSNIGASALFSAKNVFTRVAKHPTPM
jgi:hypothetical protein